MLRMYPSPPQHYHTQTQDSRVWQGYLSGSFTVTGPQISPLTCIPFRMYYRERDIFLVHVSMEKYPLCNFERSHWSMNFAGFSQSTRRSGVKQKNMRESCFDPVLIPSAWLESTVIPFHSDCVNIFYTEHSFLFIFLHLLYSFHRSICTKLVYLRQHLFSISSFLYRFAKYGFNKNSIITFDKRKIISLRSENRNNHLQQHSASRYLHNSMVMKYFQQNN